MNNKILQSIVELTQQRDLDSLEYSLVTTLAEMVPANSIAIYKHEKDLSSDIIVEVVRLTITNDPKNGIQYTWSSTPKVMENDAELLSCINQSKPVITSSSNGVERHLNPVPGDSNNIGVLSISTDQDIASHKTLINAFIKIYANYQIIFNESERDKLTGLYNRRTFDSKLRRLFTTQKIRREHSMNPYDIAERRQMSTKAHAWLAIFDIDNFKQINDRFGHVFGDEVLLTLSQKLKESFRSSDLLFRTGGEEFVIILEPVSESHAYQLFDNFRNIIASHDFPQVGTITISIGYAIINEKDYPPEVLERADRALYYSKDHGKNTIYNYEKLVNGGNIDPPKRGGGIDFF